MFELLIGCSGMFCSSREWYGDVAAYIACEWFELLDWIVGRNF